MSEFQNRPENLRGPRRRLWHFDGRGTNWKLNVRDDDGAYYASRRYSDLDNDKLMHYMQIGSIYADIEAEENKVEPVDRKSAVLKWLAALALFWLVFRFVRL